MMSLAVSLVTIALATLIAWRILMSAIANLKTATENLKAAVAALPPPGITPAEEAQVQAVADELTALAASLAPKPPPAA